MAHSAFLDRLTSGFSSGFNSIAADRNRTALVIAAILAPGFVLGCYYLGDGLVRMKHANRIVTVRGVAERDVMADVATWTVAYAETAGDLQSAQAKADHDTQMVRSFFASNGFDVKMLQPVSANVSMRSPEKDLPVQYTVTQRMVLRTSDIARAQAAVGRQFDLVKNGVSLNDGSGVSYRFTKLHQIKPEMVAQATQDARHAAEQFAKDSGSRIGGIHQASQGYFSLSGRDSNEDEGSSAADTPFQKVRVVTTVEYLLN